MTFKLRLTKRILRLISLFLAALALTSFATALQVQAQPGSNNTYTKTTLIVRTATQIPTVTSDRLPVEARKTITLIRQGGPFPYAKDGTVFRNRERRLPPAAIGYYREYTVGSPGVRNRGTKRIITGQNGEIYYTSDHYSSFVQVK